MKRSHTDTRVKRPPDAERRGRGEKGMNFISPARRANPRIPASARLRVSSGRWHFGSDTKERIRRTRAGRYPAFIAEDKTAAVAQITLFGRGRFAAICFRIPEASGSRRFRSAYDLWL